MNVAIATLWITALVAATEHFSQNEFKHDVPYAYDVLTSSDSSETIVDDSEDISSAAGTAVPPSHGSSVATGSSALPSGTSSSSPKSLSPTSVTLNAHEIEAMDRILQQTTTISSNSTKVPVITKQVTILQTEASFVANVTNNGSSTDNMLTNATTGSAISRPDVVLSTEETKMYFHDIFKQSIAWLGDTYTLSIVLPILGGFLFAMVIVCTLYTFACIRRRCRRRRLRKKVLPDTIRKMGHSDRARLLAETSDEEF